MVKLQELPVLILRQLPVVNISKINIQTPNKPTNSLITGKTRNIYIQSSPIMHRKFTTGMDVLMSFTSYSKHF